MRLFFSSCTVLATASIASAQFVVAITQPTFGTNPPQAFLQTATSTTLLLDSTAILSIPATAPGFTGLAADDPGSRFFATVRNGPDDDLYAFDYATLSPTLLGEVTRDDGGVPDPISIEGLAYDTSAGVLYGTRSLGGSSGPEGLFRINTTTAFAELVLEYETTSTSLYAFNAIDYEPTTGLIYAIDEDDTGGRNIYSIDPSASTLALSLISTLPSPITDVDGLGAGDGKLFLLSDGPDIAGTTAVEGNGGNHYVYDIASGTYSIFAPTPFPEYNNSALGRINPSGAGLYAPGLVPEPATITLIASASLLLTRRRR